ncbi:glucose 1-dehydrogenase [SAR202 cluster bacterium AD-804-J14_MRT_500m]|nr:glucose 1-dehydrogenase [SAR202 cluster bacterium AD-804-J14_MRT_500m]
MRLQNKVALITGGARGMGAVEAELFSKEGAVVIIGDVLSEGKETAAKINQENGRAHYLHLDVTSADSWEQAINEIVSLFGRLDILVNNAGILRRALIEDATEEMWDKVLDINAKGVWLGTKAVMPEMRKSGGGSIVNISSMASHAARSGSSIYGASKGAVRIFTKSTAIEGARDGIRANSVHPGIIDTLMIADMLSDENYRQKQLDRIPLARLGTSQDVANAVLYLASDESSYVTGAELAIDGGLLAQ